jgi:hypothetical protein
MELDFSPFTGIGHSIEYVHISSEWDEEDCRRYGGTVNTANSTNSFTIGPPTANLFFRLNNLVYGREKWYAQCVRRNHK